MRIGLGIPQVAHQRVITADYLASYCRDAEDAGYDGLWAADFGGASGALEPMSALSFAAAVTRRPMLGVAVIVLTRHIPARLASLLAGVDEVSGGRLIAGVGLGGWPQHGREILDERGPDVAYGMPVGNRGERMEEALVLMKELWKGGPVHFSGKFWSAAGLEISPIPTVRPHPPIIVGASSDPAIERAVRMTDGWIGAGSSPMEKFLTLTRKVHDELERQERPRDSFSVGKRLYLALEQPGRDTKELARSWFDMAYGRPEAADENAFVGSVEQLIDTLGVMREAGTDSVVLTPVIKDQVSLDQLATVVLPAMGVNRDDPRTPDWSRGYQR